MDYLTADTIIKKEQTGHAVHVYPRKHIVCVDGHKYFKINSGTLNIYKYYKKYGVIVQ